MKWLSGYCTTQQEKQTEEKAGTGNKSIIQSIIIFMWQSVVIDSMLKYEHCPLNEY